MSHKLSVLCKDRCYVEKPGSELTATSGLMFVVDLSELRAVSDGRLLSVRSSSHLPPHHLPGGLPLPLHGKREVKSQPLTDSFFSTVLFEPLPVV